MLDVNSAVFGAMTLALALSLLLLLVAMWKTPGRRLKKFQYESEEDGQTRIQIELRRHPEEGALRRTLRWLSGEGRQ